MTEWVDCDSGVEMQSHQFDNSHGSEFSNKILMWVNYALMDETRIMMILQLPDDKWVNGQGDLL